MICLLSIILLVKPSGIIYARVSMILLYMTDSSILTLQINNSEEAVSVNRIFSFQRCLEFVTRNNQNNLTFGHHCIIAIQRRITQDLPMRDPGYS
jgi:hypothetical protein